jgi:hypothetical protein
LIVASLELRFKTAAHFCTAAAPSNIEVLSWELFKPVASTTKMARRSQMLSVSLDCNECKVSHRTATCRQNGVRGLFLHRCSSIKCRARCSVWSFANLLQIDLQRQKQVS